jgi:hypothetical protein
MVGPITTDERATQLRRLKVGIAVLVGVSMAIVAFRGGGSLAVVGGAFALGTALGAALAWYIFPEADAYRDPNDEGSYRR